MQEETRCAAALAQIMQTLALIRGGGQEMLGHACRDAITYRPLIQFLETSLCVQPLISIPFTPPPAASGKAPLCPDGGTMS